MLKRLELAGFKSFADKTTFEFGPGITAVVGPNGSGKSNVVDSIRWLLGEQSARSLRAGEMTDVIFNGSTSRRSLGLAEVSMILDNRHGLLGTDAAEIQITRRVYRSGEGEYLINQQPCRLKDIKDLFLGSGAGADAYCIIAQGKVDVLLQASNQERRTIFEEAAGISRYRARKTETQRKLERIDQNVQRLKDIIDEVEKQLRGVRLQASKAQRYQEHSTRLQELRLGLGLQEYHQFVTQLHTCTAELERLRAELQQQDSRASAWEAEGQALEARLTALESQLRQQEAALVEFRQQIRGCETTLQHEANLAEGLQTEQARTHLRLAELIGRTVELENAAGRASGDLQAAESAGGVQRQRKQTLEVELLAAASEQERLRGQLEADKTGHVDQMRRAAKFHNEGISFKSQIDQLSREQTRLQQKSEQVAGILASLDVELQGLEAADATMQQRLTASRQQLTGQREQGERLRQLRDETSEIGSGLRQQRSGLASRVEVLEGLEQSHEGLGTGVREVLDLLERAGQGDAAALPWRACVAGMIADFLTVQREYAPLIDLALGDWSQRFLVRDAVVLGELLARRTQPFAGRVSFLPLDAPRTRPPEDQERRHHRLLEVSLLSQVRMPVSPEGIPLHPGIVARAEQLVSCDHPELTDLPGQLLGRTLIVRDLLTAHGIAAFVSGFRLVTLKGELLEPDGTLTVGTHHAEMGILSRKSELRELRSSLLQLEVRIAEIERDLMTLRDRIAENGSKLQARQSEVEVLTEQAADLRTRLERHRDRRRDLHEEVAVSLDEIQRLEREIASVQQRWQQVRAQESAADAEVQTLQVRIERGEQQGRQLERECQQLEQEATAGKVALAKIEERLQGLRQRHQQLQADLTERRREQSDSEAVLQTCRQRWEQCQRTMLATSAQLARGYLDKEQTEQVITGGSRERDAVREARQQLLEQTQAVRGQWQVQHEQAHTAELQVNDLRHRRDTLAERLREDYRLDLAALHEQAEQARIWSPDAVEAPFPYRPPADPAAANEEIAELRKKLARLGSVNLESLQELTELEARATTLGAQFEDLQAARKSLEEIIVRINTDSRRLFTDTFAVIRTHFQELFRKLFGGGMADIVLEDENNLLECGIEIVARPPGKELRSISLMSGGEKTLTAVALLLSIFRSKPSPFCILDEVDAALDEANIGRFAGVLREFLDRSQFIIITHSKQTMTVADVVYGITMQESGISRRVAVRFEDFPEEKRTEKPTAPLPHLPAGSNGQLPAALG